MNTVHPQWGRHRGLVAMTAASIALTLSLAACSSSGGTPSSTGTGSAATQPVTLTVQDYYTPPASQTFDEMFKQFEAAHPGVTIKHVELPGESYTTQVLQQAGSGSLPDVLMVDNPNLPQLAETGVLTPLKDIGTVDLSAFMPSAKAMVTYKDTVYAVPVITTTVALFYNKKLLDAAGLQPPKTWDELRSDAKTLTGNGVEGMGVTAQTSDGGDAPWQFLPFAWSNGASLSDVSSPQMQQTLQMWTDLVKDGSMSQSVVSWGAQDLVDQFTAGKLAMMVNGAWQFPGLDKASGLQYGVTDLPVRDASQKPSGAFGGEVWAIPNTTPKDKQQVALELLKFISSKDNAVKIAVQSSAVPLIQEGIPEAVQQIGDKLQPFVDGLQNGHQRTEHVGQNWPAAARAMTNAIQAALTGTSSVADALNKAKSEIAPLLID